MATGMVSHSKYEAAIEAKNRAVARARSIAGGSGGFRAGAGTLGGAAAAGAIDSKFGEGSANLVAIGLAVAGATMGYPDLVHAGTGALAPAVYRATRDAATNYMKA